jgi:Arc/MetJ-type ribon-helix-helix transcriptional regulator
MFIKIMAQKEISIPEKLYIKIQKRVEESKEFDSVNEYIKYVLEEVIKKTESEEIKEKGGEVYSEEDEEKVKERLRSLGYLD